MSQKLPVDGFEWFEDILIIKKMKKDEESNIGYIFEIDIKYPKNLHDLHSDLPFLRERMKINKYRSLVCNLYDKRNYVGPLKALKQALNHELITKKCIE